MVALNHDHIRTMIDRHFLAGLDYDPLYKDDLLNLLTGIAANFLQMDLLEADYRKRHGLDGNSGTNMPEVKSLADLPSLPQPPRDPHFEQAYKALQEACGPLYTELEKTMQYAGIDLPIWHATTVEEVDQSILFMGRIQDAMEDQGVHNDETAGMSNEELRMMVGAELDRNIITNSFTAWFTTHKAELHVPK